MALTTPEYLQTKQYSALRDRLVLEHGGQIQPGVWDAGDFKVTQRAAGTIMAVDVAAGFALVDANNSGNNGLYHVTNDAFVTVPITTAHATLPRVDQVVITVNDSVHGGASSDTPVLTTIDGTPTSGATLDNRNGAIPTLPANTLRIADVLVGAGVTSITNTNIRDRRPWARGYFWAGKGTATSGDFGISTTPSAPMPEFLHRVEATGNTFLVQMTMSFLEGAGASGIGVNISMDSGTAALGGQIAYTASVAGQNAHSDPTFVFTSADIAPGSHTIYPVFRMVANTASVFRSVANGVPTMVIQEVIRPVADNGTA